MTSIECYLDDLVQCFEEFVKKSLFLMSLAVGATVMMVFYLLNMVSYRIQNARPVPCGTLTRMACRGSSQSVPIFCNIGSKPSCRSNVSCRKPKKCCRSNPKLCPAKPLSSCLRLCDSVRPCRSAYTVPSSPCISRTPSCTEIVLSDIGYPMCAEVKSRHCNISAQHCPIRKCSSQPSCNLFGQKTCGLFPSSCRDPYELQRKCCRTPSRTSLCPRMSNAASVQSKSMYTENRGRMSRAVHPSDSRVFNPEITRIANSYFWSAYTSAYCHCVAIATVFIVVLLSYMLPNISHKIHRTAELKAMKKVLDVMAKEVSRAEVACITVADQIGCLQCSVQDGSTETEVMSYLYTDSFDGSNQKKEDQSPTESKISV